MAYFHLPKVATSKVDEIKLGQVEYENKDPFKGSP